MFTTQGDATGDGDGDSAGGDGDAVGDGDGWSGDGDGWSGDGDFGGDGDGVACTDIDIPGLSVRVVGGASAPDDSPSKDPPLEGPADPIAPPEEPRPLPPPMGGASGTGDECAAVVIATTGAYDEQLSCQIDYNVPSDCLCYGGGQGDYSVTATLGIRREAQMVTVTGDECHPVTEELVFFEALRR